MYDEAVIISENKRVNEKYFKLTFKSTRLGRAVQPGQFLNIRIHDSFDPFLRRPFSYYRINKNKIEILYEILGRGTAQLASKRKGDGLQAMGPLGKSFTRSVGRKKRILVAGGVGVPPLLMLAEKLKTEYLLIGTKSRAEVLPRKELAQVKGKVLYATNDGSFGRQGFVTVLLEEILRKGNPEDFYIQTCGPTVMMQAVMDMAQEYGVEGEASLEETMACGMGACLGCMAKTKEGWIPSCTEGPVFNFSCLEAIHGS